MNNKTLSFSSLLICYTVPGIMPLIYFKIYLKIPSDFVLSLKKIFIMCIHVRAETGRSASNFMFYFDVGIKSLLRYVMILVI